MVFDHLSKYLFFLFFAGIFWYARGIGQVWKQIIAIPTWCPSCEKLDSELAFKVTIEVFVWADSLKVHQSNAVIAAVAQ